MAFNRFYVISPLALVAVSACRSPYVAQNAVGGAVVKGPLSNALVFLDYNDDGVLDANEPFARTNSFGEYELTATQSEYTLVAMADDQTVDTSSGAALSGITLTAPSGAGVITPTTTLMEEGGISAEDVAAVLGLPDGINPLTFNPFDVDENDAAAVAAALEVEKVSQQIMTAVTSFASAAEGAGAGAGDAFTAALGSVVDVVKTKAEKIDDPNAAAADKEIDFTNAADLVLIKTEATSKAAALDGIDAATMNALADDTTDAIKNVNDKIATVTDLDADATKNIFSTMQVLQDQVKEAAETQKAGGTGNITFKNSAAVDTAALNKAPQAITLSGDRLVSADGELVIGTVATIDSDQTDGVAFTYTLAGDDAAFFDFNASSGELSLKAAPNYANKPYYEITIITKDEGGKKFSETFIIDVVPEFGALGDPDKTVASDFVTIMEQNPLFKQMSSEVQLKQTSDGQLVLVEQMSSDEGGYGSSSDSDGPIMAIINVSERGYELLNPATNDYMGGFFTYEEGGLTYTGYEVFVDDMSVLTKYEEDLTKYFAPDSTYGSGALKYTERDIEFVSLVGAKAVNKDGQAVQEMLGFSHYDKDMNILGSAGIDVADTSKPYYIEVVGEYDPAISTNITSKVMSDVSVGLEMQKLLQTAGEAILYGDSHDAAHGDVFNVSGKEWVLVAEINGTSTLIPVKDDPNISGQLVYDDTRAPMRELSDHDVEDFLGSSPTLSKNIASNTLEFAAIKGAGSTGLVNGDVYIVNTDEKLLLVEESDGSFALIPVADGASDVGLEYDDTRKDEISTDLDKSGVEAVIGSTPNLDDNILLQLNMYNDIVQALSSTPTFLGEVDLPDPLGGNPKISLKVAEVSEFTPGAFIGELSYDDGGSLELPIFSYSGGIAYLLSDGSSLLAAGTYAMDAVNNRVFEVTGDSTNGFEFTTGDAITLYALQSRSLTIYTSGEFYTPLDHITLGSGSEPNVTFAIDGQDLGFTVDGNKVFLGDNRYFDKGFGDNGALVNASSGGGFDLGEIKLSIAAGGDVSDVGALTVIASDGDYFGLDSETILDGGGYNFTPLNFNSFQFGEELGAITSIGFYFDTVGLSSNAQFVEIVGNTVKLKDDAYYDVNTKTFNFSDGGFQYLSAFTELNVTATQGDMDLVSAPVLYSDMVTGGQIKQAPYWAGSPAGTKNLPTDTNIKALMFENKDADGNPAGTTTYWVHDPSQDNSSVGDDIVITYSFVEDSSSKYIEGAGSSGGPNQSTVWSMNDAQKASVRQSLEAWSAVADITFVEVDESASDSLVGTMRFGFTTYKGDVENVAGWATGPGGGTGNGDVWITSTDDANGLAQRANDDLFKEGYSNGFLTLLHEIGHALGLAHPFEDFLLEGADPNTGEGAPLDNQKYTVMSYTVDETAWFNGPAYPDLGFAISHTPMMLDIAAIQWLYGAQETNEGNTVYGSEYFNPETPFAMTIWDSGGVDTIDLSAFTEGCDLSLIAGTSSTVVCKTGGAGWLNGQMLDNLSIADGAIIENAIGGSGDDKIIGNDEDNILTGGAGADVFEFNAGFGSDTITDFVEGTDKLKIKDAQGDILTANSLTKSTSGDDLVITYGSDDITLEGLGAVTFDDTFLEIV